MSKQIKVIKCPSCGNNKPISLGNDRFRCDKCGTEFFLDSDDININVNHNHNTRPNGSPSNSKAWVWIVSFIGAGFAIYFAVIILTSILGFVFSSKDSNTSNRHIVKQEPSNRKISRSAIVSNLILDVNTNVYAFCLDERFNNQKSLTFVIYDFKNDSIINAVSRGASKVSSTSYRSFFSTGNDYFVINNNEIWEVDPKTYMIRNITDTIAQSKPALTSGLKSIKFVEENNGDGFYLETNLGKSFYYFPNVDQLFTEKAFKHFSTGGLETVADDAKMRTIYLFENKESKKSSNVAQLMKINYQYNNGGPEDMLRSISAYTIKNKNAYRVTSIEAVGPEKIAFSPQVIYSDSTNIAIAYYPTLATDAPLAIELLNNKAESIWTVNIDRDSTIIDVVRIGQTIYMLDKRNLIYELSMNSSKMFNLN